MRNVFLVSYDVCDAKRLRQTYKKMCGFGTSLQYSVFRCELNPLQLHALKEQLWNILNLDEDRVMVVDLGPACLIDREMNVVGGRVVLVVGRVDGAREGGRAQRDDDRDA